jgi:hypothetical protein
MSYCRKRLNSNSSLSNAVKAYLSSVVYQFFDGPGTGVTLVEDLDPDVTRTVGACGRDVRDFRLR